MDASNMLKPMLARGELHTVGATTLDEYRKYIEKDAALERRFQTVVSANQPLKTRSASCAGSATYEIHHGVKFKDSRLWPRRCCRTAMSRSVPARQSD